MKPEELLPGIWIPSARRTPEPAQVTNRARNSQFKIRVGGGGETPGTSALVSEGRKSVLMVKLSNNDYRGEQFVTDGDKVSARRHHGEPQMVRIWASSCTAQDEIVREGLWAET